MELRVEGREIKVTGDRKRYEEAHKLPGKYGTEDDRTPWEYSAKLTYQSTDPVLFNSTFFSGFLNRILSALDAGRIKEEGRVRLETGGDFVHLIREKVTKGIVDLYNQAYFQAGEYYRIPPKPKIQPKPDSSLIVVIGVYANDPQTFMGEILHKNGDKPHVLPPNRFPHIIDDSIGYLTEFHSNGEGPVRFHNKLTGDPSNEQRGLLIGRVIGLFNSARYLPAQ